MDDTFFPDEKLYRAVYPPEVKDMFWKGNGQVSSAAFYDPEGCSVNRGNYRSDDEVVIDMRKHFIGRIVALTVEQCEEIGARVRYKPTKNLYHSEIHGSDTVILLDKRQRKHLARCAQIVTF